MTRKDYVLIAEALRESRPQMGGIEGWNCAAIGVADALARDNPRFDRERFLKAAGVTP